MFQNLHLKFIGTSNWINKSMKHLPFTLSANDKLICWACIACCRFAARLASRRDFSAINISFRLLRHWKFATIFAKLLMFFVSIKYASKNLCEYYWLCTSMPHLDCIISTVYVLTTTKRYQFGIIVLICCHRSSDIEILL